MKKITYLLALLVTGSALAQENCNLQYDGNGDGAVNVTDVLGVLSEFGEVCEPVIEYGPCGPDSTVSYHGYDYSLVEIGDQCWFAENLRTEHYNNGDAIPANLSDGEWGSTNSGAVAVYGEDAGCNNSSPDGNACDPAWSLNEYGRLYNWYAVDDERGLCPTGWHVPTDAEWDILGDFLGGVAIGGFKMKSTYGWSNSGNGNNESGFSGLPGGIRNGNGFFTNAGIYGHWWSSSIDENPGPDPYALLRNLSFDVPNLGHSSNTLTQGLSIRCIKD